MALCDWPMEAGNRKFKRGQAKMDQMLSAVRSSSSSSNKFQKIHQEHISTKMSKRYINGFVWTCTSTISPWLNLIPIMLSKSSKNSFHIQCSNPNISLNSQWFSILQAACYSMHLDLHKPYHDFEDYGNRFLTSWWWQWWICVLPSL